MDLRLRRRSKSHNLMAGRLPMSTQKARNPITLRQGQIIGEPAAEDDDDFLFDTFFEHHAYRAVTDVSGPRFLLVGRTGTGKTAMLRKIEDQFENVIRIDPQELSLQYISNSDIISFFQDNGVKLDLFYQLLWRHVLATELIKEKFQLQDEQRTKQFFRQVAGWFNAKRKRALEYMQSFGSDFWLETDSRVTQVTQKFETELKAAAGAGVGNLKADFSDRSSFSEEQKRDVVARAQKVVDSVHIQQLSEVIDWLNDDVFDDDRKQYYVVIDDLDLGFASGGMKLSLIRALIEACKKFRKVGNVKIIVALRSDLLERVFEMTRDEGFQEEKYKGNIQELEWNAGELRELVDRRVKESIRRQYTTSKIGFSDIFPERINQGDGFSYMLQRTLHRPRDIIAFVNECISKAVGSDRVNVAAIRKAEETYSVDRFNALRDEWRGHYPFLDQHCRPLINKPRRFSFSSISTSEIEDLILRLATTIGAENDRLGYVAVSGGTYGGARTEDFKLQWLDALYKVGIIGLKTDPGLPVKWNYRGRQSLNSGDVNSESVIYIHPMLWRRFGTITKDADVDAGVDA